MNQTQEQLLALLGNRLFMAETGTAVSQEILKEAKFHSVDALISDEYQTIANNMRVSAAHAELTEVLSGLPFVTIKGWASASYYPDPTRRTMGDVDFYLPPACYGEAAARLEDQGYEALDHDHERHDTYSKKGIIFELHSEIKGVPNGKDGIRTASLSKEKKVREALRDLVETAVRMPTEYGDIVVPDDFHHGLIMLLHVAGHMITNGGIGLRHLCDWAVYADRVDVSRFRDRLQDMGVWTFACQLTAVSSRYLGLREMEWAGEWEEGFLELLIRDFLNAGNFRNMSMGRQDGAALRREGGVMASFIASTKRRYRFCERYPVLLPVGMTLYGVRYLRRLLQGKRSWITPKDIEEASERLQFYEQFRLFE